jgi:hypothetical protein
MTYKTYRLATPEEIEQINKAADEAERLYFESGLADEPLIVVAPGRSETAESQHNRESQKEHGKESQEKPHAGLESQEFSESQDL